MGLNNVSCCYDSIYELPRIITEANSDVELFILTGQNSFNLTPSRNILNDILNRMNLHPSFFIPRGLKSSKRDYDEFIINFQGLLNKGSKGVILMAIGGGRVIDATKIISYHLKLFFDIHAVIIAVPTTAGSGSEATSFAVCWSDDTKYSIDEPYLKPNHVILDKDLLAMMPSKQLAVSGLDAVCQSIEAYLNVNATEISDSYSLKSLESSFKILPLLVSSPRPELLSEMQHCAYLSGLAINITRTSLPHAYSYFLTSKHTIPHGHAVGLCMANYLQEFSRLIHKKSLLTKSFEHKFYNVLSLLSCDSGNVKEAWIKYMYDISLEPYVDDLLSPSDFIYLTEQFDPLRLKNSPFNSMNHTMPKIYCRRTE